MGAGRCRQRDGQLACAWMSATRHVGPNTVASARRQSCCWLGTQSRPSLRPTRPSDSPTPSTHTRPDQVIDTGSSTREHSVHSPPPSHAMSSLSSFAIPPSTPPAPPSAPLSRSSPSHPATTTSSSTLDTPDALDSHQQGAQQQQQLKRTPLALNMAAVSPPTPAPSPRPSEAAGLANFTFFSSLEGHSGPSFRSLVVSDVTSMARSGEARVGTARRDCGLNKPC